MEKDQHAQKEDLNYSSRDEPTHDSIADDELERVTDNTEDADLKMTDGELQHEDHEETKKAGTSRPLVASLL